MRQVRDNVVEVVGQESNHSVNLDRGYVRVCIQEGCVAHRDCTGLIERNRMSKQTMLKQVKTNFKSFELGRSGSYYLASRSSCLGKINTKPGDIIESDRAALG
ncbi:hypothetical protein EDB19DRAFT_1833375 [Suillus lakei]|nr:hypothetical protein EDB19DRAFT_1833375 [Suillus lakei]